MRSTLPHMLLIIILAQWFLNCAVGPVHGGLFTSTRFPGDYNTASDVARSKKATGCIHQVLGLIMFGDAGAGKVASANGIQRIAVVDHSTLSVLGVYSQYCTLVAGE